jgi:hypothetical protein
MIVQNIENVEKYMQYNLQTTPIFCLFHKKIQQVFMIIRSCSEQTYLLARDPDDHIQGKNHQKMI